MLFERRSKSAFPKTGFLERLNAVFAMIRRSISCMLARFALSAHAFFGQPFGCADPATAKSTKPHRSYKKIKTLVAKIPLLCVSNTVLAHEIYRNLRDRVVHLCCGGQDCKPVQAVVLPNGSYYLPASGETIPADMATP